MINDEIKEINIKIPGQILDYVDTKIHLLNLFNYITNLQQELEEYKDTETYSKRFLYKANKDRLNANLELVKKLEDYKSRCEKAVEYIKHSKFIKEQVIMRSNYDMQDFQIRELLNILNGRSDE